jgi:hypothetical protein
MLQAYYSEDATEQVGSTGNARGLEAYLGGDRFETRLVHRIPCLKFFRWFLILTKQMPEQYPLLGNYLFLPYPYQFIRKQDNTQQEWIQPTDQTRMRIEGTYISNISNETEDSSFLTQ